MGVSGVSDGRMRKFSPPRRSPSAHLVVESCSTRRQPKLLEGDYLRVQAIARDGAFLNGVCDPLLVHTRPPPVSGLQVAVWNEPVRPGAESALLRTYSCGEHRNYSLSCTFALSVFPVCLQPDSVIERSLF